MILPLRWSSGPTVLCSCRTLQGPYPPSGIHRGAFNLYATDHRLRIGETADPPAVRRGWYYGSLRPVFHRPYLAIPSAGRLRRAVRPSRLPLPGDGSDDVPSWSTGGFSWPSGQPRTDSVAVRAQALSLVAIDLVSGADGGGDAPSLLPLADSGAHGGWTLASSWRDHSPL